MQGSLVPSFVAAGRRLCDVRRHFKAATQSLHTRRGPVRLSIASGRRPREQGRRSLRAYSKEEGPTGIFPYVVREGTRQRKDVRYVGKYRSGTWRVAPNLAIKGRGPVPRKWWSGRRGLGGPRKCTNWTSGSQSFWWPTLAARALHDQFRAPGSVNQYLRCTLPLVPLADLSHTTLVTGVVFVCFCSLFFWVFQ